MIWRLQTEWMIFAILAVTMCSYLVGYAMDKVLGHEGYGPGGNMIILAVGFFGGIYLANLYGFRFHDLQIATAGGMGGSFILLTILVMLKAIIYRP